MPIDRFSMLYATREKFPGYRVDLTELFSVGLAGRGHCIDWVMQSSTAGPARIERLGPRERVFVGGAGAGAGVLAKALDLVRGLIQDLSLWRLGRTGHYDCIQVRDKHVAALIGLWVARARKIPFFFWMSFPFADADLYRVSEFKDAYPLSYRIFCKIRGHLTGWLLYRVILPRADHIFVQSERMKQDVAARGIAQEKMTPVPMGISLAGIQAARINAAQDPRLHGRWPVVYVGTLKRMRRLDFLIEAFRLVHEREPRAILILVGDAAPEEMQFLHAEVQQRNLAEHVVFTGLLPREEAWAYIRAARVCVSPFRPSPILDSTSPTKVVEYLALGKPVVANDHPDQAQVLAESGAGIAVRYEPEAFARAIIELLHDEKRARGMGKRGQDYVARHRSYEYLSGLLEQKYCELLGQRAASALARESAI
jgi:glycosyltransferase involved in cell wall biosynthesis